MFEEKVYSFILITTAGEILHAQEASAIKVYFDTLREEFLVTNDNSIVGYYPTNEVKSMFYSNFTPIGSNVTPEPVASVIIHNISKCPQGLACYL